MALSYNPRKHYLGIVSMLLSSIAIMNIGDDEEDGLQDATPISCRSVWWLTTRLVSTKTNCKSLKHCSFGLVQFFTAYLHFQQEALFAQFSSAITAGTSHRGDGGKALHR